MEKLNIPQKTDLREFYANTDLSNFETLKNQLKEWQFSYNYQRLHGFLKDKTPTQYSGELGDKTPLWRDVIAAYNLSKERIQEQNYKIELAFRKALSIQNWNETMAHFLIKFEGRI